MKRQKREESKDIGTKIIIDQEENSLSMNNAEEAEDDIEDDIASRREEPTLMISIDIAEMQSDEKKRE